MSTNRLVVTVLVAGTLAAGGRTLPARPSAREPDAAATFVRGPHATSAPAAGAAAMPRAIAGAAAMPGATIAPAPVAAYAAPLPQRPAVSCAACLVAADEEVIWGRAIDTRRANASTTKMVTALVVARAREPGETVRISRRASATGGGGLDLRPGDRFTVSELLHALLLSSSNDAAVALAEHVAGSETAFVRRMNALAKDIGALRSHFQTSHGLDVAGHHSTARDLARIALAVLRSPALAPIVRAPEATIAGRAGTIRLENSNPLIESYPGAIGVKTGYTSGAGDVLVAAAHRGGRRLIAVAMGSDDAADDARALLDYGFDVLGRAVLLQEGSTVGALVFDPSGSVGAVAARTVRAVSHEGRVAVTFSPAPALAPPFAGGEPVGTVVLVSGAGRVIARAPAVADEPVVETDDGEAGELLARLLRAASSLFGGRAW